MSSGRQKAPTYRKAKNKQINRNLKLNNNLPLLIYIVICCGGFKKRNYDQKRKTNKAKYN